MQGVIWGRLWAFDASINVLRRASEMAESVGAFVSAGQAVLTLIEEHGATRRLPSAEVYEAYQRAERLLRNSQDAEDKERLLACARVVMHRLSDPPFTEKNFSLFGAIHDFEAKLIGQALDESGGSVTQAAKLLGHTHQTLISILDKRHKALSGKRKPMQKRLKSIIKIPREEGARQAEALLNIKRRSCSAARRRSSS